MAVLALAVDPGDPSRLYAGTSGSGLFVYAGNGNGVLVGPHALTDPPAGREPGGGGQRL